MKVDRNIKLPDLIVSTILFSKIVSEYDAGLKRFFRKIGTNFELCDFINRGYLRILIAARQPSGFGTVCKAITVFSDCIINERHFWSKRRNNHFRKSCVSFAFTFIT